MVTGRFDQIIDVPPMIEIFGTIRNKRALLRIVDRGLWAERFLATGFLALDKQVGHGRWVG
jgi:hypothetical protein